MAPRFQTLRPAQTASAREAMRSFFCELCQKGYSRMNEYEAHLSSYDHSHKQRLKDMKAMVRDPAAAARARRQEAKATDAVISIKLGAEPGSGSATPDGSANTGGGSAGSGSMDGNAFGVQPASSGMAGGFKKGGFRKGGFKSAFVSVDDAAAPVATTQTAGPTAVSVTAPAMTPITLPAGSAAGTAAPPAPSSIPPPLPLVGAGATAVTDGESDTDDEGYDVYDPRQPTD